MRVESNASRAHQGAGFLHATMSNVCEWPMASTSITVPASTPTAGPAVRFFYRRPAGGGVVTFSAMGVTLPPVSDWTEKIVCLSTMLVGQAIDLTFQGQTSGGACDVPIPAEELFVDDVQVTTDPSCPAN
jgi:hypothetical protein